MNANGAGAAAPAAVNPQEHYEVVQVIGKGSFGTVSKIKRRADGKTLVWKELNYGIMREKEKQLIVSEVNILRELRHPFIVRYYDRIIDKAASRLYIIMECCDGGDLGAIIRKAKKDGSSVDESFVLKVFAQMVIALKECHRHKESGGKVKPIVHRDIKPGNIFLDAQQNIKVGDFGLAKELASDTKFASTNVGTPFYMSPEMINEQKYNEKSDIWALGCLLFELCALVPPFEATNHLALAVKINAGKFNRIPAKYSEDLHRAIRWMLHLSPNDRPSVEQLEAFGPIKPYLDRAQALVGSIQGVRPVSAKPAAAPSTSDPADLPKREAAVSAREAEVAKREAAINAKIAELNKREAAIAAREKELGVAPSSFAMPSSRPSTAGSVASTGSLQSLQQQQAMFAPPAHPTLHRAYSTNDLPVHHVKAARPSTAGSTGGAGAGSAGIPTVTVNIASGIPTATINLQGEADPVGYPASSPNPAEESEGAGAGAGLPSFQPAPAAAYAYERAPLAPRPQSVASRPSSAALPAKLQAMAQLGAYGAENVAPEQHAYVPRAL